MEGNISLIGKSRSASLPEHLGFKLTRLTADRSSFETGDRDIPANRPAPQSRHRHHNLDLPSPQQPRQRLQPVPPNTVLPASAASFQPTSSRSSYSTVPASRPSSTTSAPSPSTAAALPRSKITSQSDSSGRLALSTGMRPGKQRRSVRCFRCLGSCIW